jgi:hypothetical protein
MAEVSGGDSCTLFRSNRQTDVSVVGHLKGYRDLTAVTNIELRGSCARGHNDLGSRFITQLYAMDESLRWKPERGPRRQLVCSAHGSVRRHSAGIGPE